MLLSVLSLPPLFFAFGAVLRLTIAISLVLAGCGSTLPADIAYRALETSSTCLEAAEQTEAALRALGYEPMLCFGVPFPGSQQHAWVEIEHQVIDPAALLGDYAINRSDLAPDKYVADVRISRISTPNILD